MKLLVVDDEPPARARLLRLLAELGHAEVREAGDVLEARQVLDEHPIDVMLLDVSMPGIDGLSFAAGALPSRRGLPAIVFVTGDPGHAARAFDVEAADFVTKPVRRERLEKALGRAARAALVAPADEPAPVRLRVVDGAAERYVDARRVDVFRAEHKCVVFTIAGREEVIRASLDELEAQLPVGDHIRAHRSYLVRLAAVTALSTGESPELTLRDGTRVPVSRRALGAVRAALRSPR